MNDVGIVCVGVYARVKRCTVLLELNIIKRDANYILNSRHLIL